MTMTAKQHDEPVIVSACRTPVGRAWKGSLTPARPDDLAAGVVRSAIARIGVPIGNDIEDVILGCAQPAGEAGFNLARVVATLAGLPQAGGVTVNRYCASSLQAVAMAASAIRGGDGRALVACGVETLSRYAGPGADTGPRNPAFDEGRLHTGKAVAKGLRWTKPSDGLPDIYITMGLTAEFVRVREQVSREEMDEFALRSHQRAVAAQRAKFFADEIEPVVLTNGTCVADDDCPRPDTNMERLAALPPAFDPHGMVTAGNSCPLNDGAAAVVVMQRGLAEERGIRPLARILGSAVAGVEPELMGLGPIPATRRVLARLRMSIDDIDSVEINEAFAAQVIPSYRQLGIDIDKLNVHGGAIAIGHPYGMTGARMVTTLINSLRAGDKELGLATMCVGGGQGMALVIERES